MLHKDPLIFAKVKKEITSPRRESILRFLRPLSPKNQKTPEVRKPDAGTTPPDTMLSLPDCHQELLENRYWEYVSMITPGLFACPACPYTGSRLCNLKTHIRLKAGIETNAYPPRVLQRSRKEALTADPGRIVCCSYCHRTFLRPGYLSNHLKLSKKCIGKKVVS